TRRMPGRVSNPRFRAASAGPTSLPLRGSYRRSAAEPPHQALIGRGEIFDDLGNVGIGDRRAVELYHFRHLDLPEILLEFRPARLGLDVVGGVTGGAVVLHHFEIGPRLEGGG